jgi:hypothetical protein
LLTEVRGCRFYVVTTFPFNLAISILPFPSSPFHYHSFVTIMMVSLHAIVLSLLVIPSLAALNVSFASYDNDFIEPSYILGKKWNATTIVAQESIVQWADWLATQGPWCKFMPNHHFSPEPDVTYVAAVTTSKSVLAPSNDSHDYLSWAPKYVWPIIHVH